MKRLGLILGLLLITGPLVAAPPATSPPTTLRIAAARSAADSGVLNHLAAEFGRRYPGIRVEVTPVGALQALDRGREGQADLVITHHPQGEALFEEQGHALVRVQFMYGQYALFGPPTLRAEFAAFGSITEALKFLHDQESPFLVPSPRSGTYRKIEELWALTGVDHEWLGYENTGTSSSAALLQSALSEAYTIADTSIYYTQREQLAGEIVPLFEGDIVLRNTFSAIVVAPALHPGSHAALAQRFVDFLVSPPGQALIHDYSIQKYGVEIYRPSAHLDAGLQAQRAETALQQQQKTLSLLSLLLGLLLILLLSIVTLGWKLRRVNQRRMQSELERKQAQFDRDVALSSNKIKNELVSVVSHELRTPLTSIIASLSLLQGLLPHLSARESELLTMASRNSNRLLVVINDLLDMEKLQSGSLQLELAAVPIHALLEDAVDQIQDYAQDKGTQIVMSLDGPELIVEGDRGRLMQVMANLLSNAVKYAANSDAIRVACERLGDIDGQGQAMVRVSVSDQGPGIAEAFRDQVFDRFTQIDSSSQRKAGGTGLGLAISKSLIEQHGGRIGFEPNTPQGSIFYFLLPLQQVVN